MEKQTIESLLENVEFNTLTQIYYQFFSYDFRLPDLFSSLGEVKSRRFIIREFNISFTFSEVEAIVKEVKENE